METREECRSRIEGLREKIKIIRSDTTRDPRRVEREHEAGLKPLQEKLARLQRKRTNGPSLIAAYEARIAELKLEHDVLLNRTQVRQLIAHIRKVNDLGGDLQISGDLLVAEESDARDRMREIRGLLRAYDCEIAEVRQAMSGAFEQREAKLQEAIDKRNGWFDDYCANVLEPDARVDACLAEIARLTELESKLAPGGQVADLKKTFSAIAALMADMGTDKVTKAMSLES